MNKFTFPDLWAETKDLWTYMTKFCSVAYWTTWRAFFSCSLYLENYYLQDLTVKILDLVKLLHCPRCPLATRQRSRKPPEVTLLRILPCREMKFFLSFELFNINSLDISEMIGSNDLCQNEPQLWSLLGPNWCSIGLSQLLVLHQNMTLC